MLGYCVVYTVKRQSVFSRCSIYDMCIILAFDLRHVVVYGVYSRRGGNVPVGCRMSSNYIDGNRTFNKRCCVHIILYVISIWPLTLHASKAGMEQTESSLDHGARFAGPAIWWMPWRFYRIVLNLRQHLATDLYIVHDTHVGILWR